MAPELLGIEESAEKSRKHTSQSDVFALGMVAIEVITSVLSDTLVIPKHLGAFRCSQDKCRSQKTKSL